MCFSIHRFVPDKTELDYHKYCEHSNRKIELDEEEAITKSAYGKRLYKTPDRVQCSFCESTFATRSIYYK